MLLRPMQEEDAGPLAAAFVEDPDLGRLLGSEVDPTEAQLKARIALPRDAASSALEWAIVPAASESCVGSMLLHSLDAHHRRCELGFYLVPSARRQGLGHRALTRTIRSLFEDLELERVELTTTPDNAALRQLALGVGFREEGTMRARNLERGSRVDVVFFGLLRSEWSAR